MLTFGNFVTVYYYYYYY